MSAHLDDKKVTPFCVSEIIKGRGRADFVVWAEGGKRGNNFEVQLVGDIKTGCAYIKLYLSTYILYTYYVYIYNIHIYIYIHTYNIYIYIYIYIYIFTYYIHICTLCWWSNWPCDWHCHSFLILEAIVVPHSKHLDVLSLYNGHKRGKGPWDNLLVRDGVVVGVKNRVNVSVCIRVQVKNNHKQD